ncbi:MAG TPA: PstS family phosphate ABC transporter substrate-binding protein [Gaiellaceae bacterium]|nr:PstS family phosphate ABC transporter substrate-binding protein [Gaiellaceae bacterium]
MSTKRRLTTLLTPMLVLAFVAASCGGSDEGGELSGTIRIDGSSTVGPLSEVAAELFQGESSGVRVTVATSGTSGGFQKFCIGETDMNDASRPIKDSEIELCDENGIGYEGIQVANDALSLVVNPRNPIDCLTVAQASQIWDQASKVTRWGDIHGLELPSDMAGQKLDLYGPGTDSGTFDFFTEAINGEEGRVRTDYNSIGEDDQAAIVAVEGDEYAMGYIPYSFVQEAGDQVKALAIDGGDGCVDATLENVQNGSYTPLGRPLFVYASDTALQKPEVLAFMKFYLDNSEQIAEAATFVPLTAEQIEQEQARVDQLAGS